MPHYQISPYLQERYVLAGQSDVYAKSNELINSFLRIEVNAMQVHRVTNTYGELSADVVAQASSTSLLAVSAQAIVYAELDASMVLTREDKWQEVKVGRLFTQDEIHQTSASRTEVFDSLYCAKLGTHTEFCEVFKPLVDKYESYEDRLVFITDGALWIKNWLSDHYKKATIILDYYHVSEYIGKWCHCTFADEGIRKAKYETYKTLLLEGGGKAVLEDFKREIALMSERTQSTQKQQEGILNYFEKNLYRMDYPQYRQRGLCIGSGAIEAAHRTVVQKRMKLSGQRWSKKRLKICSI